LADLIDILKKILRSYDFEIVEEFPNHMIAEKEGSKVACAILPPIEDISFSDLLAIKKELPPELDKVIIVSTMEIAKELVDASSQENILLWDKKKLEEEIGRAVLSNMEGDFLEEGAKEILADINEVPQPKEEPEEVIMPPTMDQIKVKIESIEAEKEGDVIIKPQVTMRDVSEISKRIVQGFRFDLELVPYYVFDYSCELIIEGTATPTVSSGILAVNGLTNHAETWEFQFETVSDLETTHTKLEPKFDEKKAFGTAKESAVALNTREIQTVDDRGSVTIYEKKKVRPKEGAIDIKQRGLFYLPVWCVEGSNGVMIINATTGKVLKEDIYRESDDVYNRSGSRGFSF
jgi:hypothetical protein